MKISFIRHGATQGNIERRYIGSTDEDLLIESVQMLKERDYPIAKVVFTSPMKRCVQTAQIIYGKSIVIEQLREIDFGDFENKNYLELQEDALYQQWLDSRGKMPFPNGESSESFKQRCITAFSQVMKKCDTDAVFVIHGGTIMAILEHFSSKESEFYDWQVENANGFTCDFINNKLENIKKLW